MPNVEWLNAQNSPARTIIRNGGVLSVNKFRVTQGVASGNPTVVCLETNGLLRVNSLTLDTSKATPDVTFLFNGGALQSGDGSSTDLVKSYSHAIWDGVKFAIGPGGAVFDNSNDQHIFWRRPLVKASADALDGGLTARGGSKAVCLMVAADYNGPTTVDGTTLQQRGGDNLLPSGTKLVLKNGGIASFCTYASGYATNTTTHTAATLGGIEGNGTLNYCTHVTVTGKIAPSNGGTITFHKACTLNGTTLEIDGDTAKCGKVKFQEQQDISGITLSIKNVDALDKKAGRYTYKILEATNGIKGEFDTSELPAGWHLKYSSNGVYLRPDRAMIIMIR